MALSIAEVSAEAETTGSQAIEVHASTAKLAGAIVDLKSTVITTVREASVKVEAQAR